MQLKAHKSVKILNHVVEFVLLYITQQLPALLERNHYGMVIEMHVCTIFFNIGGSVCFITYGNTKCKFHGYLTENFSSS
jgi:hypothetical protein